MRKEDLFFLIAIIIFIIAMYITKIPTILILAIVFCFYIMLRRLAKIVTGIKFGDYSLKRELSLNPLNHFDMNTMLFIFVLLVLKTPFIIGFGKPLNINYYNFKNYRKSMFLIGISSLLASIFFIILSLIAVRNINITSIFTLNLYNLFQHMYIIGISLSLFNLLPIGDFDMSYMIIAYADDELKRILFNINRYLIYITLAIYYFIYSTGIFKNIIIYFLGFI